MRCHIDKHDTITAAATVRIEIEPVFRVQIHAVKFFENRIDRLKLFRLFHFGCSFLPGYEAPAGSFRIISGSLPDIRSFVPAGPVCRSIGHR